MDEWTRTLKSIIDESEHLPTLIRATEISPYVTERTIGPDLVEPAGQQKKTTENKANIENQPDNNNKKENKLDEIGEKGPITSDEYDNDNSNIKKKQYDNACSMEKNAMADDNDGASSVCETVQNQEIKNVLLRHQAENQIKQEMYKGFNETRQRQNKFMLEKSATIQQENKEQTCEWLKKKLSKEVKIQQSAYEQTVKESQDYEEELYAERKRSQQQLQKVLRDGIFQYQVKIRKKYKSICGFLMHLAEYSPASYAQFKSNFYECLENFEELMSRVTMGDYGFNELEMADELYLSFEKLEDNILETCNQSETFEQSETNQLPQQQGQQLPHGQEQQQQGRQEQSSINASNLIEQKPQTVETNQQQPEIAAALLPSGQSSSLAITVTTRESPVNCMISGRLEFYKKIKQFFMEKINKVKILQSDDSNVKKYRLECQKFINIPVNTISGASKHHLQDKYFKLWSFIMAQNDLERDYCVLLITKKFVEQAETITSNNPYAIFPIATIIVTLWKQIPDFGQLLLAQVFKASPFMLPYVPKKKPEQSFEEYAKLLGYRTLGNQLENQNIYLKRQAGIARLYAAIMITNGKQTQPQQNGRQQYEIQNVPKIYVHPYGLENAWRWLASIVQLTPLPDISATVIMEFLNIVGYDLWKTYDNQFAKLLIYIHKYYLPVLSKMDNGGPKQRFEILLTNLLKEGKINKPIGMLPPNFW